MRTKEKVRERISEYKSLQLRCAKDSSLYREYDKMIYILNWVIEE